MEIQAQHVVVRGTVTDSTSGQVLEEATLSLFKLPKPELVGTKRSDTAFAFSIPGKGNYVLVTSYQGYRTDSMRFSVKAKDSSALLVSVMLVPEESALLQVVVQARIPPAIVRSDTIAFNAGAYPSPPNSTVEDLLRKLPGVEIDKDGNVTMQGQKVDKITINGKDFFLNDLRNATQNLPADLVAQVEVFDTRSEKAKMTGIKGDSKTKTINLKLKKKEPQGFFGKLYGGLGSGDSYSAGGNATKLDGPRMIFLSGNANNINNQFTGTEHQNGPGSGTQTLNNQQLNYRDAWGPKLTATIDAGRSYSNSLVNTQLSRQTALGDSSILQNSISSTQNKNTAYNAFGLFEYAPDSSTKISMNTSFASQQTRTFSPDTVAIQTLKLSGNYLSSIGKTDNSSNGTGNNIDNSLSFSHQFEKKGRQVYFNISQNSSNQNQNASLYSTVDNFDSSTTINQQSGQKTNNNGYAVGATYIEPIGKHHLLDFSYSLNHSNGHSDKESFDYDSLTGKYDRPDSLTTNRFLNHNTTQSLAAAYNKTEGKYQYQIGITGQLTQLNNLNLVSNQNLQQQEFNLIPRAFLLWEIKKERNVSFTYTENNQLPSIDQLQPVPDLTNPYLIKVGNPELKQQLTHTLNARYADFNSRTFQNWQINITSDFSQNQITSNSIVLPGGVQEVEYVNVAGVWHGSASLTYGFPLNKTKNGNASFSLHGNTGHDISLVNGAENITRTTGLGGSVNINFHVKDMLFIDSHINIDQTNSKYSLTSSPPAQTLNENYSLNINYRLPGAVTIASYYTLQVTGGEAGLPSQAVSLWNAALYKSVLNQHCELRLSAYDLLNSASSFSQTTGVNYTQTQKTNLPGRILLFSIVYRFRKMT
jgi:Outer membrane protein beta-barrel family